MAAKKKKTQKTKKSAKRARARGTKAKGAPVVTPVKLEHTPKERERALRILDAIAERFPDAKIELDFREGDPWQLLVAVVLSAQSTDAGVNKVTPLLFQAFADVRAFAKATPDKIEPFIKTLGLYRNKAKSLVGAAQKIMADYDGNVPRDRVELEKLPGVGSKSAAVIVANCFDEPAIAVDTHVGRVTRRIGLTQQTDPDKVEAELTALLPRERLLEAHHVFIWHGRRICDARKPKCSECPVERDCWQVGVTVKA